MSKIKYNKNANIIQTNYYIWSENNARNSNLSADAVKDLLGTDTKGTQIVFNNAPNDDIKSYGKTEYLSTPQVQKEIAKRKEQPHKTLERERLKYSGICVDTLSECHELETARSVQSDRIEMGRKNMTQKTFHKRKPSALTQ